MIQYKTVLKPAKAVFTEKKSEFISVIAPAESEQDALGFISDVCRSHRKARHNCYAYICREASLTPRERYSDDGEPQGTAGIPILEVLRNNGLSDAVLAVTRYFGGILLGAGGLTRAYAKAAAMAVRESEIVTMNPAKSLAIEAEYSYYGRIKASIAEFHGLSEGETFTDVTRLTAVLPEESADGFTKHLTDICNGAVVIEPDGEVYMRSVSENEHGDDLT